MTTKQGSEVSGNFSYRERKFTDRAGYYEIQQKFRH